MKRPRLFAELFAGTASTTLRLVGGPRVRPPVGCVIYLDPPYVGCTPYAVDCPRGEVLRLAREYSAAGATVAISEACALADELGAGWDAVELTHEKRGQVNPHRRLKSEWLTVNRPPAGVRGVQLDLLGAA